MCGVYGFVGPSPASGLSRKVHAMQLSRVAYLAGTRGPHAHGWAQSYEPSGWQSRRRPGSASDDPDTAVSAAPLLVGHSRMGTSHRPLDPLEAQPMVRSRVALAHNGVVRHLPDLEARESMITTTDSEVLAILVERALAESSDQLADAVADTIERARLDSPFALVVADAVTGQMTIARQGLPLHFRTGRRGTYVCSRPWDGATELPDGDVRTFAREDT